jgi:hypothetical protein
MTKRRTRSGSFPLMNLAEDFGVAYGDVLLMAEGFGASRREEPFPTGRLLVHAAACQRVFIQLGAGQMVHRLCAALADLADARWGAMF